MPAVTSFLLLYAELMALRGELGDEQADGFLGHTEPSISTALSSLESRFSWRNTWRVFLSSGKDGGKIIPC